MQSAVTQPALTYLVSADNMPTHICPNCGNVHAVILGGPEPPTEPPTIEPPTGTLVVDFANGFTGTGWELKPGLARVVGGGWISDGEAVLTSGDAVHQAGAVWWTNILPTTHFVTDFTFALPAAPNGPDGGMTFAINNYTGNPSWSGAQCCGHSEHLGYASGPGEIKPSMCVKFDVRPFGSGNSDTGVFTNGQLPNTPAVSMLKAGVDLNTGHKMAGHIEYDGKVLKLRLTDTVTQAAFTHEWPIDIPAIMPQGYFGFTAGTNTKAAKMGMLTWIVSQ